MGWKVGGRRSHIFVIQEHDARRHHFDFRLEVDGILKSWAVPKGPSTNPRDKRLAVEVEDHSLDYANFEGVIPEGEYGSGFVIVWDTGTYRNMSRDRDGREVPMAKALEGGQVEVWLEGKKIVGGYVLVRTRWRGAKKNWLLIKKKDEAADPNRDPVVEEPRSVLTDRTLDEVAGEAGEAGKAPRARPDRRPR